MMDRTHWFLHPVVVFILSVLALGTSLFLYIYWYIEVSTGLKAVVERFQLDANQVVDPQAWVVILVLSILVGVILLGIFTIFVYNQKVFHLYRLQHNFISNFTHELKTPVTSLKLYLETFRKHQLSRAEQSRYIDYMIQDVDRLAENITRILNLAKIESGDFRGEFETVEVSAAVKGFLERNAFLFHGGNVRFTPAEAESIPVRVDRTLLDILLVNLINNGLTYNRSGAPEISIQMEKKHKTVSIRFTDNGIGIEKADLRKIFRKFYQVGRSDDMTAKGTGIGLHLAQSIARIHRGRIVADSQGPGKGATFTLKLPTAT
jgi:signal transduction histidine kinase